MLPITRYQTSQSTSPSSILRCRYLACWGLWDLCLPGPTGPFGPSGPASSAIRSPSWPTCPPGALWTLRTCGTSLTSGPIGTRDFIRTLHAVHYDVGTLGPLGPHVPTSPRGPSARPCRLQTDSLHSTDARCYRCTMRKDMSPFSFPGILEPSHLVGSLKSPRGSLVAL